MKLRGEPIHVYHEADEAAARDVLDLATTSNHLLREIAGAVAKAREEGREAALAPLRQLLTEGPGSPAGTFYKVQPVGGEDPRAYTEVEWLEVPMAAVRAALEESSSLG